MWAWLPVIAASTMSRSTITSSAAEGMPRSPSCEALNPSWATPSPTSVLSSQWSMTGSPSIPAYSRARRISSAVATGRPSSENATQPASRMSAISASSLPSDPFDTAPIG